MKKLTRRDFLKLSGAGVASLFAPSLNFDLDDPFHAQQGRATIRTVWAYERPTLSSPKVQLLQQDAVFDIANTALGEDETAHNRVWYHIEPEGYVYSGSVQPVRTIFNKPQMDIPKEGLLAEVSVPFTDAHVQPARDSAVAYRIYYETTHWIKKTVTDEEGQAWYQIRDDKWDKLYYARAEHIRVMTAAELEPISPDVPKREKRILVRLDQQVTIAYESGVPVFAASVATGGILRSGTYTTPQGKFTTYYKRPSRHMAAGDIAASGFDLPGVPWVQYITPSGISFHGTYWHNDFGRPRSHGCINLSMSAAKWLYRWSQPHLDLTREITYGFDGTNVEITV